MIGRFISQDDISELQPNQINGLNLWTYCGNNPVMRLDSTGRGFWDIFGWIAVGIVAVLAVAAIVIGTVVTGGALGALLIGAGIGGLVGMGGSIVSQGLANGFDNINPWQVAFNGLTGFAMGAVIASPLGGLMTGLIVGGIMFTESVGNDLFDNGGDWSKVDWGKAVVTGILSGGLAGVGKYLLKSSTVMNKFINRSEAVQYWNALSGAPASYVNWWHAALKAQAVYKVGLTLITPALRFITKSIIGELFKRN